MVGLGFFLHMRVVKPSITYGPKDNMIKVSIGFWGGWVRKEMTSSLDEREEDNEKKENDEALVGVIHSKGQKTYEDYSDGNLGPEFYLQGDQGEFQHWFMEYPESIFGVTVHFLRLYKM